MARRNFFRKGVHARAVWTPKPPKRPKPEGLVQVRLADNTTRVLPALTAARIMGAVKGAETIHANGKAHAWTSESARAAINKRWAKHPQTRLGMRRGARLVRRPPVKRQPLRDRYAVNPERGVRFDPVSKSWWLTNAMGTRKLSELAALRRLGHLPRKDDKCIPVEIIRRVDKGGK